MYIMNLSARVFGIAGSLFGLVGVALGAFGAHGLQGRLTPPDMVIFETAVRYQMVHALALLVVAWRTGQDPSTAARVAGWLLILGVAVFSGSLFFLVLTGPRWLGGVTPVGGVALLAGWGCLGWSFLAAGNGPGGLMGGRKDHLNGR